MRLLLKPAEAGPCAEEEPAPAEERKERDTLRSFSSSPMRHMRRKELPETREKRGRRKKNTGLDYTDRRKKNGAHVLTQVLVASPLPKRNVLVDNSSDLVHKSHGFRLKVLDDEVEVVDVAEAHDGHHPEEERGRKGREEREGKMKESRTGGLWMRFVREQDQFWNATHSPCFLPFSGQQRIQNSLLLVHIQVVSDNIGACDAKADAEEPGDFLEGRRDESSLILSVSVVVGWTAARSVQLAKVGGEGVKD